MRIACVGSKYSSDDDQVVDVGVGQRFDSTLLATGIDCRSE